ncbi:RNA polymerase sigma factor [Nonomuraea sp. NPDC059023]|uniref:RNA polymerase sigma factor n=1 Tax=unclassified Nonomuraea TaxID=2593643 RepID=UPI00369F1CE5
MAPRDRKRRFEEIYAAQYPDILAYIRRRMDGHDDAADALAETFSIAWRRLDDIPEGRRARLWLYGVARKVVANGHRAESRRSDLVERLGLHLAQWAEASGPEEVTDVRKAFSRLSQEDREVLSLAGWEGLSSAEIATVLGCSRGAARIRLHRARKRLARELEESGLDLARYGSRAIALAKGAM